MSIEIRRSIRGNGLFWNKALTNCACRWRLLGIVKRLTTAQLHLNVDELAPNPRDSDANKKRHWSHFVIDNAMSAVKAAVTRDLDDASFIVIDQFHVKWKVEGVDGIGDVDHVFAAICGRL